MRTLILVALVLVNGLPPAATGTLTIKGSDTMVHLVTAWAESFGTANPAAQVSVTGGGSGTGIAAILNGTTHVCMSSRDISAEEKKRAATGGFELVATTVARDGIAVVVHASNPVGELTMDQLRKIYTGAITSWKDLGGPEAPIQALSRETNSGTYAFVNEHVLKKDDFAAEVRLMPSSAAIVQAVRQDRWSIGYVGLGYAAGQPVKIVGVRADSSSPAIPPQERTVTDGTYPIARALYLVTRGQPSGNSRLFIDHALSADGQRAVTSKGYVAVK